jgi:surfactin synthase thioesterase subunit
MCGLPMASASPMVFVLARSCGRVMAYELATAYELAKACALERLFASQKLSVLA